MKAFPSPVDLLNVIARIGATRPLSVVRYGRHPRHVLDIYPAAKDGPSPVIVFFYGGGWEDGERSDYLFVGHALAERGITTVIPDYRVFPEVRFPGFLQDAAEAMRWTVDHIAEFGGDPRRVIAMGHSAGAHIAAMLAFDRQWLLELDLDASVDLRAIIGLAGPYDFLPLHSRTLKQIFGPENGLADTQPINFVDAFAPPAFLATGNNDPSVDPGNTIRLAERMRSVGGEAETKLYDRVNHRTLIGAFAPPLRFLAPVLDDVAGFALKHTDQQLPPGRPAAQERSA
ncbi:thioesterase [Mesorhizobium hungaricum]|jgi:acetyl esterase/lipase|uniref:Thioesterase n=1 Tax=Mesorhizobium hungaricum TaxID=1566387 RepID=A0A1C2E779_9HYPH|nr:MULTISPECIES: alpha/beta hydrolase [Mesorhizobium]MBN9237344.1 alpha/beta hydrolase [Mesorhizobium sp.]MDQ0333270.1 acetyl esterase/lipase [Mesorhizobium sp. YL-MeA3-2017]OCX22816.1 thioesterase [Mesorhizobium hungaricum]